MKLQIELDEEDYRTLIEDLLDKAHEDYLNDEAKYLGVYLRLIKILFCGEEIKE